MLIAKLILPREKYLHPIYIAANIIFHTRFFCCVIKSISKKYLEKHLNCKFYNWNSFITRKLQMHILNKNKIK